MAQLHMIIGFGTNGATCPVCREEVEEFHTEALETFSRWMCFDCAEAEFESAAEDEAEQTATLLPFEKVIRTLTALEAGQLVACLFGMVICFRAAWSF